MKFDDVYRLHYRNVRNWLMRGRIRPGSSIDPDDVTQETFLQAWRQWDTVERIDNIFRWLLGIAKFVYFSMLRSMAHRPEGHSEPYYGSDDERSVPATQGVALYVEQLRRHFAGLGPAQCSALTALSHGSSAKEHADSSGRSLPAVTMAISLGRKRLSQRLEFNI